MNLQSNQQSRCFDECDISECAWTQRFPHESSTSVGHERAAEDHLQKKEEIDKLIAQALTGLTFEERQQHQEIIHGVDDIKSEEASLIDGQLQELERHLMLTKEGSMYALAEKIDSEYVHNRTFLVMFLRANEYDAKAAADQILRFFEFKHGLFGKSKLTKDITLEDLDEDGRAALERGWVQHGGYDQSGRQVLVQFGGASVIDSPMALMGVIRSQYFFTMRALKSEEAQMRGTVCVLWAIGSLKNMSNGKGYSEIHAAARALPLKKAAIHMCVDDVYQYALLNVSVKIMKGIVRARTRVHMGSRIECEYQLATFGILSSSLPLDDQGGLDLSQHRRWLLSCAAEDKVSNFPSSSLLRSSSQPITVNPSQSDVVLFRNGRSSNHKGNLSFRAIIKDYSHAYALGNDDMKRQIVATVVGKVQASGGRFLKQSGDSTQTWEEVPSEELRKKIMQAFRNRIRQDSTSKSRFTTSSIGGVLIGGKPNPNDVIFGRSSQSTPGTELLNRQIKEKFEEYESLDRGRKIVLVEAIMQQIKDHHGRFLQSDPETGRWIEVSNDNARERISKSFRNLRRQYSTQAK